MTELDVETVRGHFPAFAEPALEGWAFFENAGGSYPCRQVVDRLTRVYAAMKVQPHAPYPASEALGAMMDESVARLAGWLGVSEREVHVGPSTSQNTYVLAQALREWMSEGDEIVVTDQDHEANAGAWRRLARSGITVREWRVDRETGRLDAEALDALLTPRTRAVCFPHVSNIVGEINPVARIAARARAAGALSIVDGVSAAPHGLPDVPALGADIYMFSTYKTWGPHQGVMTVREEVARALPNQGHFFNADKLRARLTPAGPDHAQIAALGGIADYLEALDAAHAGPDADPGGRGARVREMMRAREVALARPLLDHLRGRNDIRLIGPDDPETRAPTVSIAHARPGHDLAADLAGHRIMAGGGAFYADRLVRAVGVDPGHGVLRLSFLHYTTAEEIERLIAALDAVL